MHRSAFALLLLAGAASAQTPAEWVARYDGPTRRNDRAFGVAVGPQGRVALVGGSDGIASDEDMATVVFDSAGQKLWEARYNGPGNGIDRGAAVGFDALGNVYVTGNSWGGLRPEGSEWDYVTIKYSPAGQQLWVRRYNGLANWADTVEDMRVDAAGNCYLAGFVFREFTPQGTYATHFHVLKYNAAGDIVWDHQLDNPQHLGAGARAIDLDAQGNVYATGDINSGDAWNANHNIITVKVNAAGEIVYNEQWSSTGFNTGLDDGLTVHADEDGNTYVGGIYMENDPLLDEHFNTVILKYGPTGALLWASPFHLFRGDEPDEITTDAAANVYVAGAWGNSTDDDGYVFSLDSGGQQRWTFFEDEPQSWDQQAMLHIRMQADGTVVAAGNCPFPEGYDSTLFVFTPAGELLSKTRYDFGSPSDWLYDMAMGPDGAIYLAGASPTQLTLLDYAVAKVPGPGGPAPCYANCDGSTAAPTLNVLDFNCFLNRFSAGDSYANCDGSTAAPALNVLDFNCFLNQFSQGCP